MKTNVDNNVKKLSKHVYNEGFIDAVTRKYMTPRNSRPGRVKANPKVHKKNMPMGIISSGMSHPTEHTAEIAGGELDQFVRQIVGKRKDTEHRTFDFKNLYSFNRDK